MSNDFKKMTAKAVEIRSLYSQTDPKQWEVEQVFMGLVKDIGELSKKIMIKSGYRSDSEIDIKTALGHELVDILYSLLVIADKTGVDLEKVFWENMTNLENKLKLNNSK